MAVLIDPPRWPAHGRLWSHLASDSRLEELHQVAARAGIPRRAFEGDHYDVPAERYDALVRAGAVPVEGRELLRRLVASGLRVPKRRGEHVVSSEAVHDYLPGAGPGRLDVVRSRLPAPRAGVHDDLLLDADHRGAVLLVRSPDGRWALPKAHRAAGRIEVVGYERLRLDGEPAPTYAHPRPWAFRQLHAGRAAGADDADGERVPAQEAVGRLRHDPLHLLLATPRGGHGAHRPDG